jgi:hypothetical protein
MVALNPQQVWVGPRTDMSDSGAGLSVFGKVSMR